MTDPVETEIKRIVKKSRQEFIDEIEEKIKECENNKRVINSEKEYLFI